MTTARIIKDSISQETGTRLTTMLVRFHRFILPEVNTHRVFSRNTSSSRAKSIESVIKQVLEDPAIPVSFGKNARTMFSTEENDALVYMSEFNDTFGPATAWVQAARKAAEVAEEFSKAGYHKQVVNRLLEPFVWTDMIISSTEWDNFFNLRTAPDAQPEIKLLAEKMKEALVNSTPNVLREGDWHLPFVSDEDYSLGVDVAKLSAVRCARVSYRTPKDDGYDVEKDLALFDTLHQGGHYSPLEHCAQVCNTKAHKELTSNFKDFAQLRRLVELGVYA